jgi:hypothetical protein
MDLLDVKVLWQREMVDRAPALKSQIVSNSSDVQRQPEAWEAESVHDTVGEPQSMVFQ